MRIATMRLVPLVMLSLAAMLAQSPSMPVGQLLGTGVPAVNCTVGQYYFRTDATAGSNIYLCTALPNVWSPITAVGSFLYSTTTSATHAAASEVTVVGVGSGSLTLPANYFSPAGTPLTVSAAGYYSTPIAPGTLRIRLKVGAATVLDTGAFTPLPAIVNAVWSLEAKVIVRTTGVGGTVMAQAEFRPGVGVPVGQDWPMLNTAAVALDTTLANAVNLTAEWSAATGETITGTTFLLTGPPSGMVATPVGERYSWYLCQGTNCMVTANVANAVLVGRSVTMSACYAKAGMAPTGTDLNLVVRRSGVTNIFNTDITIPAGSTAVATEIGMAAGAALTAGQYLTVDITQIGSVIPGQDISLVCIGM